MSLRNILSMYIICHLFMIISTVVLPLLQGVKEVTLLGQNVNSYRDTSSVDVHLVSPSETGSLSKGFQTIYKPRLGGLRFGDLLDRASQINPEMRIRFTSPHPKDFPDEVSYNFGIFVPDWNSLSQFSCLSV